MGIFRRIGNAIARLMYGRNGMDQLNLAVMVFVLILDVVTMLVQRRFVGLSLLFYWLSMALWVLVIFRMFSKNLTKRRGENSKFTAWLWRVKSEQSGAKARHADKEHKYFTCKNCKAICRVPMGKGKIVITCPKCGAEIHGKT